MKPASTGRAATRPRSSPREPTRTPRSSASRCSAAGARRTSSAPGAPTSASTRSTPTRPSPTTPLAWSRTPLASMRSAPSETPGARFMSQQPPRAGQRSRGSESTTSSVRRSPTLELRSTDWWQWSEPSRRRCPSPTSEQEVRRDAERKRIMDAIRMATDNAESALARLIAPHDAPGRGRGTHAASGDLRVASRPRDPRWDAPRSHRSPDGTPTQLSARRAVRGPDCHRDRLLRHRADARLVGEGALKPYRDFAVTRGGLDSASRVGALQVVELEFSSPSVGSSRPVSTLLAASAAASPRAG